MVLHHLAEYLEQDGIGLSLLCEQTGESLHSDFKRHWSHYQVKDIDAPKYGQNLLNAIVSYNSIHI